MNIKTLLNTVAFMSDVVETVVIVTDNGPLRINKSDYNEKEHKLHKPKKNEEPLQEGITATTVVPVPAGASMVPTPSTPASLVPNADNNVQPVAVPGAFPTPAAPQQTPQTVTATAESRLVMPIGKKFFVVNANGEKIIADGIDSEHGYKSEADAWAAALPAGSPAQVGAANAGNAS